MLSMTTLIIMTQATMILSIIKRDKMTHVTVKLSIMTISIMNMKY
jgi:hypothetical protein